MLDSKRAKGVIKLGANSAAGTVMTHKQGKIHAAYIIYKTNLYYSVIYQLYQVVNESEYYSLFLVEQLLQESSYIPPQKSAAAVTDLRCLCTALLEALNDKTLALAHQKKANK